MTTEPSPRFTGIFIPAEILEITDLSFFEMLLLSWIDALYCPDHGGCFASNAYLGSKIKNSQENTVAKALTRLRRMGLIEDVSFDGRTRVVRALIHKFMDQSQGKQGLDKRPTRVGHPSNQGWTNVPSSPYIESKEENKGRGKEKKPPAVAPPPPDLVKYGEFVEMTLDQRNKLIEKFGEEDTKAKIAKLDTYMGSTGKKYKSHYHTILNWHEKDKKEKETISQGRPTAEQTTNREYAETVERAYAAHPDRNPTIQVLACGSYLEIYTTVGHVTPTQIKYSEHGFKEQVQNALRKWGLK